MSNVPKLPARPNLREVTKTTLPLLSTVLAGFALTLIFQNVADFSNILKLLGLILITCSFGMFVVATIYALWGQSYDYQDMLNEDVKNFFKLNDPQVDFNRYIDHVNRRWQLWHTASIVTFSLGLLLFAIGAVLIIWEAVGYIVAVILVVIILLFSMLTLFLRDRELMM